MCIRSYNEKILLVHKSTIIIIVIVLTKKKVIKLFRKNSMMKRVHKFAPFTFKYIFYLQSIQ